MGPIEVLRLLRNVEVFLDNFPFIIFTIFYVLFSSLTLYVVYLCFTHGAAGSPGVVKNFNFGRKKENHFFSPPSVVSQSSANATFILFFIKSHYED